MKKERKEKRREEKEKQRQAEGKDKFREKDKNGGPTVSELVGRDNHCKRGRCAGCLASVRCFSVVRWRQLRQDWMCTGKDVVGG